MTRILRCASTTSAALAPRRAHRLNLSLIGPPGSGKGTYGAHFARSLDVPLVTVSDLLRALRPDLSARLSAGQLVDDVVVGETVLRGLRELREGRRGYVLDGFPRSARQATLMAAWPPALRVASAVHLRVPDFVCRAKMLGRRACSRCGNSFNMNGVRSGKWDLPAILPAEGRACAARASEDGGSDDGSDDGSGASCDWSMRRDDDTPEIVEERLRTYHLHADPVLEYFKNGKDGGGGGGGGGDGLYRLLTLTPHRGFKDLPSLIRKLHSFIDED